MTTITPSMLYRSGACKSQYRQFVEIWPDGAEVTQENVLSAIHHELDIDWFVFMFFSCEAQRAYHNGKSAAWVAFRRGPIADFYKSLDNYYLALAKVFVAAFELALEEGIIIRER